MGKGRRLPSHAEFSFLIVFGFVIIVIDVRICYSGSRLKPELQIGGYMGCPEVGRMMCEDINTMHILFGVFMVCVLAPPILLIQRRWQQVGWV